MINFFDSKVFNCKGHKGLREGWNAGETDGFANADFDGFFLVETGG